nr:ribonuclease H-like domain-containing protein [Tanacetum cinerariifolium]
TKKTNKNLLKQQYGNFKAEGSETLEKTVNRLGSQINFEDINQIDEDDIKEMDIKWNIALLSMRADRFWKKTGKKISIQGIDVAGFDKSKSCLRRKKGELETKLTSFQTASKDLENLLESQRLDKNKKGLRYSVVPPPSAQIYSPPKKDMSWTGLPEFKDDTVRIFRPFSMDIPSFMIP